MGDLSLHLSDKELEALNKRFPDLTPEQAAKALIQAELNRRYGIMKLAAKVVSIKRGKR